MNSFVDKMSSLLNKKASRLLAYFVFLFLYLLFLIWRYSSIPLNSDYANLVLEANDVIRGNFFRNGWNLTGISFLSTDLVYFMIGGLFAGVSELTYVIACALMQFALVLSGYLLIKDSIKTDKFIKLFIYFVFALLPGYEALNLLRAHTGGFVLTFIHLFLFRKIKKEFNKKTVLLDILVVGLAFSGDPIIFLLASFPMMIVEFYDWICSKIEFKVFINRIILLVSGIFCGFFFDLTYFLISNANKWSFLGSRHFVAFENLGFQLKIYIQSLLCMTNAYFENQGIVSINTLFYFINACCLILFFVLIIANIVNYFRHRKYDYISLILGIGFIIISLLLILTDISYEVECSRYLAFLPAFVAIVFIRNLSLISINTNKIRYFIISVTGIVLLGCIFNVAMEATGKRISPFSYEYKDNSALVYSYDHNIVHHKELAQYLSEKGLTSGYATFWDASSITVLSNDEVHVRAVNTTATGFVPLRWFSKDDWYSEEANFIVVSDESDSYGVTSRNVNICFGDPIATYKFEEFTVYVFDYDISSLVK